MYIVDRHYILLVNPPLRHLVIKSTSTRKIYIHPKNLLQSLTTHHPPANDPKNLANNPQPVAENFPATQTTSTPTANSDSLFWGIRTEIHGTVRGS